jgi:hypothetical protein
LAGGGSCRFSQKAVDFMSILQSKQTLPVSELIEQRFRKLADVWVSESAYVSSSSDLVAHPAFREIVEMGPAIVPLLLRELSKRTGHWHRALRRVTGVDPVALTDAGNIDKAAEAWLKWGKENGYEW